MAQAVESLRKQVVEEERNNRAFFDAIGRPELKEILTPFSPWVYVSMEFSDFGLKPNGGLGILAGDTALQAKSLTIPFTATTLLYPKRWRQIIDRDFYQQEDFHDVLPEEIGFEKTGEVSIRANEGGGIPLGIYQKSEDGTSVIGIFEQGLRDVYHGENNGEHRLYQEVVLGFGGHKAMKALGINFPLIQLNESATTFFALSELDWQCKQGRTFDEALKIVREKTVLTNHTLVQTAESWFSSDQIKRYVSENIESEDVKNWITEIANVNGGYLRLSDLAILLSGNKNGVSKIHAKTASETFIDCCGNKVEFKPITNGIFFDKWIYPDLLRLYREFGAIDDFDLPIQALQENIEEIDPLILRRIKNRARGDLRSFLKERKDQYGNGINIPEDAKIACWAKRFADYKRPGMLFENPDLLASILEAQNIHILLGGKAHPTDELMKREIQRILKIVDQNPILKERVHFVQDYDENVGKQFVSGVDIWFNTPTTKGDSGVKISTEACGTSWMKALANLTIIISTEDGGVADVNSSSYQRLGGDSYDEETISLYATLREASKIVDDKHGWDRAVKNQLCFYLPVISGARMIKDYLNFFFPPQSLN